MDLVEQLNQEEHAAHQRHPGTPGAGAGGTGPAPWAAGAQPAPTLLAALTSTAAGGTAPMSTESASFADVLSRLQHSVAGTPAPVATPAPLPEAAPVAVAEEPPTFVRLGADPWPVPAAPGSAPEVLQQPLGRQQPMVPETPLPPAAVAQPRSIPPSRADHQPATACPAAPHRPERAAPRRERRAGGTGDARSACRHRSSRTPATHPPSTGGCCPGWSPDRPHRSWRPRPAR